MNYYVLVFAMLIYVLLSYESYCEGIEQIAAWKGSWGVFPTSASWSLETRIPMTSAPRHHLMTKRSLSSIHKYSYQYRSDVGEERGKFKVKRRFKKLLLPLLLAYKLKFFTLVPVIIGGLVLLTGATGLAGFFFALFAAVMGLKSGP